MIEKIILTPEILLAAEDYIPCEEKDKWVAENAVKCFDRLAITADGEPVPPMYMVNASLKSRYLMAALVGLYLRQGYEAEEANAALMSVSDYDRWAGSHIFCQIDRMKHRAETRNKCYDLLADYRELEKRFSAQLNGLLTAQNDAVIRQGEYTAQQMKDLPQVVKALQEYQEAKNNGEQAAV